MKRILVPITGTFHGPLRIRRSTGTLDTEGLERVLSHQSAQAITLAKQLQPDAEITAVHLDRGWGEGVIREALALGANHAILVEWSQDWDCDASTRARTIADLWNQNGPFDLIIGPSDSSFGGFSGVLAAVAGCLELPCFIGVQSVAHLKENQFEVNYGSMFGIYKIQVTSPCVILSGDVKADTPTAWGISEAFKHHGILRVRGDAYNVQKARTQRIRIEEIRPEATSNEEVDGQTLVRRLRSRNLIPEVSSG